MYSLWKQLLNVCVICKLNYYSVPSKPIKFSSSAAYSIVAMILSVADLGEGPGGPGPLLLILGKKRRNDWRENGRSRF